jgi:hypothetical protein
MCVFYLRQSKSKRDFVEICNIQTYINPLIERGLVRMTEPDKPKSKRQKFISTRKQKQAGGL